MPFKIHSAVAQLRRGSEALLSIHSAPQHMLYLLPLYGLPASFQFLPPRSSPIISSYCFSEVSAVANGWAALSRTVIVKSSRRMMLASYSVRICKASSEDMRPGYDDKKLDIAA